MTAPASSFDPGQPDGVNQTLDIAISPDGTPEPGRTYDIPARCGMAVRVKAGEVLTVTNPAGYQVCDFWIFNADDLQEYSSMEHMHTSLLSIFPKVGDGVTSNLRRPLMTISEDTSPGIHDTVIANCDHARYQQLGVEHYHENCADNLRQALIAIGCAHPPSRRPSICG